MKIKRGLTLLVTIIIVNQAFSQNKKKLDLVSVSAEIVGKGNHTSLAINSSCDGISDSSNYFTLLSITNNQDTAIHFVTMLCSWEGNWTSDNDSILLYHPCCDMNFPIEIKLEPHKSVKFYGLLRARYNKDVIGKFRLGVTLPNLDISAGTFYHSKFLTALKQQQIHWSNELKLEDHIFGFKIEGKKFKEIPK